MIYHQRQRQEATVELLPSESKDIFLQIVEAYAYDTFSQKWTTLLIWIMNEWGCAATTIIDANSTLVVGESDDSTCELIDLNCNSWVILESNNMKRI